MRQYLEPEKLYEDQFLDKKVLFNPLFILLTILLKVDKLCEILRKWPSIVPVVGFSTNEIEVRRGLTWLKEYRIVVGLANSPIAENKIHEFDSQAILALIATKIMMFHITSIDRKISLLFVYFPTTGITADDIINKVKFIINKNKLEEKTYIYQSNEETL